jgi:hypothetical protein
MAPLRYDGLYGLHVDGISSYMRFYEDGMVVDTETEDAISDVAAWLQRGRSPHILPSPYVVSGDSITITVEAPNRFEYTGTIRGDTIVFRSGDPPEDIRYGFTPFADIAVKPAQLPAPLASAVRAMYAAWCTTAERRQLQRLRRFIPVRELPAAQRTYNTWIEDWLVDEVEKATGLLVRPMVPFMQRRANYSDYCLFANQGDNPEAIYVWYHDQRAVFTLVAPSFRAFIDNLRGRVERGVELPL